MVILNGTAYRLCGLDTCILSVLVEHQAQALRGFLALFPPSKVIPCFSPYTLFELRSRTDVYKKFVSFFDIYPCVILKNEEQLFNDELASYPHPKKVEASLFGFSALNRPRGMHLRGLLDRVFSDPVVLRREVEWPSLKQDLLRTWGVNKSNFPPRFGRYKDKDARRFVREATIQHVMERAPAWSRDRIRTHGIVRSIGFPSVRMILYTLFFRLYANEDRVPESQDVFDVLISAPTPYLDAVITENFQAEIYSKVKKLDLALARFAVHRVRDLHHAATKETF